MELAEFASGELYEAAATRMLQIGVEAILDVCSHVAAREGWGVARSYQDLIEICAKNRLYPPGMAETLKGMARFRNRVVHLYDDVDPAEVLNIIKTRLDDFAAFISAILERYFPQDPEDQAGSPS
jgi:uncharacterized protein YutE (UPF0331/DUF86 family)